MVQEIRFRNVIRTDTNAQPHFPSLVETVEQALDHVQELPLATLDLTHWRTASRALWEAVDFPADATRLTAAGLALCTALAAEGWLHEIPLA